MPAPVVTIHRSHTFSLLPDGERIAVSGRYAASVSRMVSLATGKSLFPFEVPPAGQKVTVSENGVILTADKKSAVYTVAVSDDGAILAFATEDSRVIFYDTQGGQKGQSLRASDDHSVVGFGFAPGSRDMIHATGSCITAIEADRNGKYTVRPLRVSAAYPDHIVHYAAAFSASGDSFAALWSDQVSSSVSLFEWPSGKEIKRLPIKNDFLTYSGSHLAFGPDGQSLLFTNPEGAVLLLSLTDAAVPKFGTTWIDPVVVSDPRKAMNHYTARLCFSPDGTLLAYGVDATLSLWEWPSGKCLGKWKAPGREPTFYQIEFSQSSSELILSFWWAPKGIFVYRVSDFINR